MAQVIKFGITVNGTIADEGQTDGYTFTAKKNDAISVNMGSSDVYPEIKLYGPNATLISEADSFFDSELNLDASLNQNGKYTLLVSDLDGYNIGDYGLTIQRTNKPGNADSSKFGVPVTGTIADEGQTDTYTFTGKKNDAISISMGSFDVYPEIRLYSPNGTLIAEADSFFDSELNLDASLNQNGTYTLLVSDLEGYNTGDYGLTIQRTNKPGNADTINFLTPVTGTINDLGQEDSYTFTGKAGDLISLNMGSEDIYPEIKIYNPKGDLIAEADSFFDSELNLEASLNQNGTYTLLVSDLEGYNTGDYGLTLAKLGSASVDKVINGNGKKNNLKGDVGNDTINGKGGNDTLSGRNGDDKLIGGSGKDILNGGNGDDTLLGGNSKDILRGGNGDDLLDGGKGSDNLTGGRGKDQFLFSTNRKFRSGDLGIDKIVDFKHDVDDIILDKTTFGSLNSKAGNGFSRKGEFAVVKSDNAAAKSQAEIVYNSNNGKLFYNPNGKTAGFGGGGVFADLTDEPTLSRSDFILQN